MKKTILRIVLALTCLSLIFIGFIFIAYFLDRQEQKEEMVLLDSLQKELRPDIDSYPELKKYYLDLFNKGLISQDIDASYKPMYQRVEEVELITLNCSIKIYDLTEDELALGLKKFDNEINTEGYDSLHSIMEDINKIPPIARVFTEYKADNKITDRELCTLANMYERGLNYQSNLIENEFNHQTKSEVLQ